MVLVALVVLVPQRQAFLVVVSLKGVIRPAYALTLEVMKTNKGPDALLMIEEELF